MRAYHAHSCKLTQHTHSMQHAFTCPVLPHACPGALCSYDDRPGHFIAPWEHEERSVEVAMARLVNAATEARGL